MLAPSLLDQHGIRELRHPAEPERALRRHSRQFLTVTRLRDQRVFGDAPQLSTCVQYLRPAGDLRLERYRHGGAVVDAIRTALGGDYDEATISNLELVDRVPLQEVRRDSH